MGSSVFIPHHLFVNYIIFFFLKSVKYDHLGELSPEKDCLW